MDLAALIVAVVAVAISLGSAVWSARWSMRQHRETTRPNVLVEARRAVIPYEPIHVFSIAAVNDGLVPVTIASAFAEVEGASDYVGFFRFVLQSGGNLPVVLGPGEAWNGCVDGSECLLGVGAVAGDLPRPLRVRAGVSTAGRRKHYSQWFDFDPGEWERHMRGTVSQPK